MFVTSNPLKIKRMRRIVTITLANLITLFAFTQCDDPVSISTYNQVKQTIAGTYGQLCPVASSHRCYFRRLFLFLAGQGDHRII